jgi:hypothetical protein
LLQFYLFYFPLQFIYLPLSDLILAINEFKGIGNPLARVGCKYLLLCVGVVYVVLRGAPIGSITFVLTDENTYRYYISSPFRFEENPNAAHK